MGLSASQSRLLLLTARKSDLEFRGQTINNRRLALSMELEQIAGDYSDGISNRRLYYTDENGNSERLSLNNLNNDLGFTIVDSDGNAVDEDISDAALEQGLRNGTIHLVGNNEEDSDETDYTSFSNVNSIDDDLYDEDDEAVTAEYEYKSAQIETSDKRLELELKNVDTQHNAVQTELDAVKKVIDKNIQSSFKTFG